MAQRDENETPVYRSAGVLNGGPTCPIQFPTITQKEMAPDVTLSPIVESPVFFCAEEILPPCLFPIDKSTSFTFQSTKEPLDVLHVLHDCLGLQTDVDYVTILAKFKIKAVAYRNAERFRFDLRLYWDTDRKCYLLEGNRRNGDPFVFQKAFWKEFSQILRQDLPELKPFTNFSIEPILFDPSHLNREAFQGLVGLLRSLNIDVQRNALQAFVVTSAFRQNQEFLAQPDRISQWFPCVVQLLNDRWTEWLALEFLLQMVFQPTVRNLLRTQLKLDALSAHVNPMNFMEKKLDRQYTRLQKLLMTKMD